MNETGHVTDFAFVNSFDGRLLLRQPVFGLVDDAEAALTHFFLEEVLILDVSMPSLDEQTLLYNDILVEPPVDNILL